MSITFPTDWRVQAEALRQVEVNDLYEWLERWSNLEKQMVEEETRLYCEFLKDTGNAQAQTEFDVFIDQEFQEWQKWRIKLQAKALLLMGDYPTQDLHSLAQKFELASRYRSSEAESLDAEAGQRANHFAELQAKADFNLNGEPITREELQAMIRSESAAQRERAYRVWLGSTASYAPRAAQLFLELVNLRQRTASQAKAPSYAEYRWGQQGRTDYSETSLQGFRQRVREQIAPRLAELREQKATRLGLHPGELRPWDLNYLPDSHLPQIPPRNTAEFEADVGQVLGHISPEFARTYQQLLEEGWLDLHARPGKAAFSFFETYMVQHRPWVSTSGLASLWRMSDTLHEMGHALHRMSVSPDEWFWHITAPTEFQEFVAQCFEALGLEAWTALYHPPEQWDFLKSTFWERALESIVTSTAIDEFQTWVYAQNPGDLTPDRLFEAYARIRASYPDGLDWSGLEDLRSLDWLRMNTFDQPFYMIEYALAWTGVFQFWANFQDDPAPALERLKTAMQQGGYRQSLSKLLEQAGVSLWPHSADLEKALNRVFSASLVIK